MSRIARSPAWPLVAVLLALFLAYDLGAVQTMPGIRKLVFGSNVINVKYVPDPNDIVNLVEGAPYTVPVGKLLIITDWVVTNAKVMVNTDSVNPAIRIDGLATWGGGYGCSVASSTGLASSGTGTMSGGLRAGVRANGGQVITLHANSTYAGPTMFASGYLADATP